MPDSDVVGGADDLSYFIKRVTFKLHETYANPTRSMHMFCFVQNRAQQLNWGLFVDIDKPPFEITETGFVQRIKPVFRDLWELRLRS